MVEAITTRRQRRLPQAELDAFLEKALFNTRI